VKIAVYAICKNEEKHVARFLDSCAEADRILVCDTGSTDGTWAALCRSQLTNLAKVGIHVEPWRFDDARNAALALLPANIDVCVVLDLDEVLVPGWREVIEAAWRPETTRLSYRYVWSWSAPGEPAVQFVQNNIHARHGYRWRLPVHEVLSFDPRRTEVVTTVDTRIVEHHADPTKSRSQYLDLLALAAAEAPNDDRVAHYYGRELMFRGEHEAAITQLSRHLRLPGATWKPERATSMRFIARCLRSLGKNEEARFWLLQASGEDPTAREPWVDLAQLNHDDSESKQRWARCFWAAQKALEITVRPSHYLVDPDAWGSRPHDLLSIACWNLGQVERALEHARIAAELDPRDARLASNVRIISELTPASESPQLVL